MRPKAKVFISYFPILLIAVQVAINLLYFLAPNFYQNNGFYLNTFFGTNIFFSVFLVFFTFVLKFCAISRAASLAELSYGIFYLVIQDDGLYNVLFQVIAGLLALGWTFKTYITRYPLCKLSLLATFLWGVVFGGIKNGNCKKALDKWEERLEATVKQHKSDHQY